MKERNKDIADINLLDLSKNDKMRLNNWWGTHYKEIMKEANIERESSFVVPIYKLSMSGSFTPMIAWCDINADGAYSWNTEFGKLAFWFEQQTDAILFKLSWSGAECLF
jgi:hypothetical protein